MNNLDLTNYILQYENGIFLLGQLPEEIKEYMEGQFKFGFKYGLKHKQAYYVKTIGTHTYLREW